MKKSAVLLLTSLIFVSCESYSEKVESSRVTAADGFKITEYCEYTFTDCDSSIIELADASGLKHDKNPVTYPDDTYEAGTIGRKYSTGNFWLKILEKNSNATISVRGYSIVTNELVAILKNNSKTMSSDIKQSVKKTFIADSDKAQNIYEKWWLKRSNHYTAGGRINSCKATTEDTAFVVELIADGELTDELRSELKGLN